MRMAPRAIGRKSGDPEGIRAAGKRPPEVAESRMWRWAMTVVPVQCRRSKIADQEAASSHR